MNKNINVPSHYKGSGDIDLIEFFYQQWGLEALKAVTSFNIQRYALRLGRKDAETKELEKIIAYAQRYIEKIEEENSGVKDKETIDLEKTVDHARRYIEKREKGER